MKSKISTSVKIFLSFLTGIAICYLLYYLFDVVWNGFFIDWFTNRCMIARNVIDPDTGKQFIIYEPIWANIKETIFFSFCLVVCVILSIVFLTAHFHAKHKSQQTIIDASRFIQQFMDAEVPPASIFPNEYSPISTQMVQIKYTMEHHEQILKEEAQRRNDLITYLAHDLKTPLTSVIGYLSLLNESPDMPPAQRAKYVDITLNKAIRLEKLVNEFFEITRYNLQQIVLEKETIDLYYMMIQMTDEFFPILEAHGNEAELTSDKNITIYGDPLLLARVFNNILKNAIAYSYPDTKIRIQVDSSDSEVKISISNQGKTIPRQKLDAIFEKFFRLDDARSTNNGGAGLGLAIAREIVTLHDGKIYAESQNEVTTFTVILPR